MYYFNNIGSLVLVHLLPYALAAVNSTPQALNPDLKNTIGDNGGPVLYYNGSGPVPPFVLEAIALNGTSD